VGVLGRQRAERGIRLAANLSVYRTVMGRESQSARDPLAGLLAAWGGWKKSVVHGETPARIAVGAFGSRLDHRAHGSIWRQVQLEKRRGGCDGRSPPVMRPSRSRERHDDASIATGPAIHADPAR